MSYKDQRDYDLLPGRIEETEARIAEVETNLSNPDLYASDAELFEKLTAQLTELRGEKDEAEQRWLELAEMVEALGN